MEKETKKSVRRFNAGDVIQIEFTGKNKPCDVAMALLITPFMVTDSHYTGSIKTALELDVAKLKRLPGGCLSNTSCRVEKVTGKMKAWFFEAVAEL